MKSIPEASALIWSTRMHSCRDVGLFTDPVTDQNNNLCGFSVLLLFSVKWNLLPSQQTTYRLWFGNASSLSPLASVARKYICRLHRWKNSPPCVHLCSFLLLRSASHPFISSFNLIFLSVTVMKRRRRRWVCGGIWTKWLHGRILQLNY